MRYLFLFFISFSVYSEPAILSFDASATPDVSYNVYKNDTQIITEGLSLTYEIDKNDGDNFYVRSVLDGDESSKSNVKIIPYAPTGLKITTVTTTTTTIEVQ